MHHGVTFDFGSAKVCSPARFETCFSFDQDILIAATDQFIYFCIIVLFPLTAIHQLIIGGLRVTDPPIRLMCPTSVCTSTFFVSGL